MQLGIKSAVSVYVIFHVMCRWRRKELFLTAVPIFLLVSSILAILATSMRLNGITNYADSQLYFWLLIQYFYNTGHLIFVIQYLQTSYALPYLLEDARVSIEFGDFEKEESMVGTFTTENFVKFQGEY